MSLADVPEGGGDGAAGVVPAVVGAGGEGEVEADAEVGDVLGGGDFVGETEISMTDVADVVY